MTDSNGSDPKDRVAGIYERHAAHIAAYALRRCESEDAADVVAETFLVVWRRHGDVPDEPLTLPWLYGVARRVLANQRRSRYRRGRLRDRLASEFAGRGSNERPLDQIDDFREVAQALRALSEHDAEILRLLAWEALSPAEVATVLDIPASTARQRIARARKRLRQQLHDGLDEPLRPSPCPSVTTLGTEDHHAPQRRRAI